jgi:hypothetical protein
MWTFQTFCFGDGRFQFCNGHRALTILSNFFHHVNFRSHKFSFVKINYEIHDKEFLAIMDAFDEWQHLLEKIQHEIIVYSNHKNLQYFMTTRVLNQCQAQWALSLF